MGTDDELANARRASDLIPGDPARLRTVAHGYGELEAILDDGAATLRRMRVNSWQGKSADRFYDDLHHLTNQWSRLATAYEKVRDETGRYSDSLEVGRGKARQALALYHGDGTRKIRTPQQLQRDRAEARDMLTTARESIDTAGATAAATIASHTDTATDSTGRPPHARPGRTGPVTVHPSDHAAAAFSAGHTTRPAAAAFQDGPAQPGHGRTPPNSPHSANSVYSTESLSGAAATTDGVDPAADRDDWRPLTAQPVPGQDSPATTAPAHHVPDLNALAAQAPATVPAAYEPPGYQPGPAPDPAWLAGLPNNDPRHHHGHVTVAPPVDGVHENLWHIASRELGDGNRWPELYRLNQQLPQPDGSELHTPTVIHPGWVIALPDSNTPGDPTRHDPIPHDPDGHDPNGHNPVPAHPGQPTTPTPHTPPGTAPGAAAGGVPGAGAPTDTHPWESDHAQDQHADQPKPSSDGSWKDVALAAGLGAAGGAGLMAGISMGSKGSKRSSGPAGSHHTSGSTDPAPGAGTTGHPPAGAANARPHQRIPEKLAGPGGQHAAQRPPHRAPYPGHRGSRGSGPTEAHLLAGGTRAPDIPNTTATTRTGGIPLPRTNAGPAGTAPGPAASPQHPQGHDPGHVPSAPAAGRNAGEAISTVPAPPETQSAQTRRPNTPTNINTAHGITNSTADSTADGTGSGPARDDSSDAAADAGGWAPLGAGTPQPARTVELAELHGLGLTGPAAAAAARGLLAALLHATPASTPHRATASAAGGPNLTQPGLTIGGAGTSTDRGAHAGGRGGLAVMTRAYARWLLADAVDLDNPPSGVHLAEDLEQALDEIERHILARVRHAQDDPGTSHAPLVLFADPTPEHADRIQAVLDLGAALAVAAVFTTAWPTGTSAVLTPDGTITAAHTTRTAPPASTPTTGPDAADPDADDRTAGDLTAGAESARDAAPARALLGARLFLVTAAQLSDMLPPPATTLSTDCAEPTPRAVAGLPARAAGAAAPASPDHLTPPQPPVPRATTQPTHASAEPAPSAHVTAPTGAAGPARGTGGTGAPSPGASDTAMRAPEIPDEVMVVVCCFGPLRLYARREVGAELTEITAELTPKQRLLLICLAQHPRGVSQDTLLEAGWPEVAYKTALQRLQTTLSQLRRKLRLATGQPDAPFAAYLPDRGLYFLGDQRVWVDYWAFEHALATARTHTDQTHIDALEQAVALYTGPLFDRDTSTDTITLREDARVKVVDALAALAEHHEPADPRRTEALLSIAFDHYPTHQPTALKLIRHHEEHNQPDAAHRVYDQLAAHLPRGLRPDPAVTAALRTGPIHTP